jgi:hypothetical protein
MQRNKNSVLAEILHELEELSDEDLIECYMLIKKEVAQIRILTIE